MPDAISIPDLRAELRSARGAIAPADLVADTRNIRETLGTDWTASYALALVFSRRPGWGFVPRQDLIPTEVQPEKGPSTYATPPEVARALIGLESAHILRGIGQRPGQWRAPQYVIDPAHQPPRPTVGQKLSDLAVAATRTPRGFTSPWPTGFRGPRDMKRR